MGYKARPPARSPAAEVPLFNRNLVVDAGQVDALSLTDDPGGDVDDDRDHVSGDEIPDGADSLRKRCAVQVVGVERPLVEHEGQENRRDHAYHTDQRQAGDLVACDGGGLVEILAPPG